MVYGGLLGGLLAGLLAGLLGGLLEGLLAGLLAGLVGGSFLDCWRGWPVYDTARREYTRGLAAPALGAGKVRTCADLRLGLDNPADPWRLDRAA